MNRSIILLEIKDTDTIATIENTRYTSNRKNDHILIQNRPFLEGLPRCKKCETKFPNSNCRKSCYYDINDALKNDRQHKLILQKINSRLKDPSNNFTLFLCSREDFVNGNISYLCFNTKNNTCYFGNRIRAYLSRDNITINFVAEDDELQSRRPQYASKRHYYRLADIFAAIESLEEEMILDERPTVRLSGTLLENHPHLENVRLNIVKNKKSLTQRNPE